MAGARALLRHCPPPLLLPQDRRGAAYEGFVTAQGGDFHIRLLLPVDLQLKSARIECSWRLKKILRGCRHILKQRLQSCPDLVRFVVELKTVLVQNHDTITLNVHDNNFCAVNPNFIAVVTECAGGGAFLVIPIKQTGKLDPHYLKVCGHKGNVLDIKWNPFNDFVIASCSEDATVKIWDIPNHLLKRNITTPKKELLGHTRRVGLIEWHPTAENILFSSGYDYKIIIWNLEVKDAILRKPVKILDAHKDVVLSMSFNTDGSLLATACSQNSWLFLLKLQM